MDNLKTGENLSAKGGSASGGKKRILLVTRPIAPPWDEASKNFAFTLAKNLPDFEFGLLTNGLIPNLPENIHQEPIYTSNNFDFLQKFKLLKHLKKLKKNNFDILHFLFTPTKLNTFLNRKIISKLQVKTIQTIATLREDLYSDKEIKKMMFADKIVTYSKYAKVKLNNLCLNNTEQVYPGIDLELYKPAEREDRLMRALNISINNFVVTYPGEFTRLGATDDILNMIYQYTGILVANNIKIIFACRVKNDKDKQKKEAIRKILKEKGLTSLVRLPDTFTTMEKVFNFSDVVIFPVRDMKGKFDVPLAVVEAMACGKPVIISDLPILSEFSNNENSVIIQVGNQKQLQDAIIKLYQDKQVREMVGEKARQFVEENFDIKKIVEEYKLIYNSL